MTDSRLLRSVRIEDEAYHDINKAIRFYNRQAPGLGRAFLHELAMQIRRIRYFPHGYPKIDATRRRATLQRFPFVVVYRVHSDQIEIVGVLDGRGDPATIQSRQ